MRQSRSNKRIFSINGRDLFKYADIKIHLESMVGSSDCKDTIVSQPCYEKNCSFLLYIRGFENYDTVDDDDINIMDLKQIAGFLTVTIVSDVKNKNHIGEIFNLCHNSDAVSKELLNAVIKSTPALFQYWIALPLNSSKWNPLINTIVETGFDNPVLTHYSPSGKRLNYDYMSFIFNAAYFYAKPSQKDVKATIDKTNLLKQKLLQPHTLQNSKPKTPKPKTPKKDTIRISPPVSFPLEEYKNVARKDGTTIKIKTICLHGYQLQKYIAEGTYGVVYKTCAIDGNCNYVIKIQKFDSKDSDNINDWHKEVKLTKLLNEHNIGAKIAGSWLCDKEGFIVSELWDGDLKNYECPPRNLVRKLKTEIETLHGLGYVHGDILPKNILVKRDQRGRIIDATLSDFGTVDTPQNWKKSEKEFGWIETFYDYHINDSHPFNFHYYKNNRISLSNVIDNPSHLDMDLIYYFENFC